MKAFVNIRAAGRFANRMQTPLPQFSLQQMNGFEMSTAVCEARRAAGEREAQDPRSERERRGSKSILPCGGTALARTGCRMILP